jgi:predicted enzyme related to lactoylglutathione lyase
MAGSAFIGVHHVAIAAHDAARLQRFYTSAAALRPWPALDALALPGDGVALAGPNCGVRVLPGADLPRRRPVSEAGITHVCLQSTRIATLRAAHLDAGATFHSPLVDLGTGFLYCYARDPEYNVTELEGVADVWPDATPWIAHVNVAAADMARLCDFYAGVFGSNAQRGARLRNDARFDAIAELPGVELRMAWVPAGNVQIELIHYTQPASVATSMPGTRRQPGASGHASIALEVADLDAATALLLQLGGTVAATSADDAASGLRRAADPEGNALWLLDSSTLTRHSAAIAQLGAPDVASRFAAARLALQGSQ